MIELNELETEYFDLREDEISIDGLLTDFATKLTEFIPTFALSLWM